jgi:GH25 family lysozyme M1 (1,4-beta-N-acetylmuramidase)
MFGIDISRYQKGMNLANAKADGVQFAIIKAGG